MISTPLGEIDIYIDGVLAEGCIVRKLENDKRLCPDLDGRFAVIVNFKPDGRRHTIRCYLNIEKISVYNGVEDGERLCSMALYDDNYLPPNHWCGLEVGCKLNISVEYDSVLRSDGSPVYDYGVECFEIGYVDFLIYENTKTEKYVFGIAWQNDYDGENAQVWLGSDPTLFDVK